MRRLSVFVVLVVLVLWGLALVRVELLYRWEILPTLESRQQIQTKHFKQYQQDVELIRQQPIFQNVFRHEKSGKADAGSILNPKLSWSPPGPTNPKAHEPLVPLETREELLRFKNEWMSRSSTVKRLKADFSIFKSLDAFDHWDIETNSPISELMDRNIFVPPPQLPVPEPLDLLAASKLRLMRGSEDNAPLAALGDVRNLARLLLTTENLQLVITGLALLDDERRAYTYFVDQKGLAKSAWTPIDRETVRTARRVAFATRGYLRLWTEASMIESIYLKNDEPFGLCAALNEALPREQSLRPMLDSSLPFERDYREAYARLDHVFARAQSNCRLRYLTRLMQTRNFKTDLPGLPLFNRIPMWRQLFGLRASLTDFAGFEAYERLTARGLIEREPEDKEAE